MRLGVIADDFTGATDIAGFLVENGMQTVMFNGVPNNALEVKIDAAVVSLKIRSCPVEEAVVKALEALAYLQTLGCDRFYYKYCSTFDSTHEGNIGQVVDALMEKLGTSLTLICPSLPVNGRTVYKGYLFVQDTLLNESSMRHHPITPMKDAKLSRLMEGQFKGTAGHVYFEDIAQGAAHIKEQIEELQKEQVNYVIVDILKNADLDAVAEATESFPLVTGGSGLAIGIAHLHNLREGRENSPIISFTPKRQKGIVIAGSCSKRTNEQVAQYKEFAPHRYIEEKACLEDPSGYAAELAKWVLANNAGPYAPLVYATKSPEELEKSIKLYGDAEIALLIESVIHEMTILVAQGGTRNFLIAGGETSGVVATALELSSYLIGNQIDPGVSWIRSLDGKMYLSFKSGNFGSIDFFVKAQEMYDAQS